MINDYTGSMEPGEPLTEREIAESQVVAKQRLYEASCEVRRWPLGMTRNARKRLDEQAHKEMNQLFEDGRVK